MGQEKKGDLHHGSVPGNELDVFLRVWHVAKALGRRDLHDIMYQTLNGPFWVSKGQVS